MTANGINIRVISICFVCHVFDRCSRNDAGKLNKSKELQEQLRAFGRNLKEKIEEINDIKEAMKEKRSVCIHAIH